MVRPALAPLSVVSTKQRILTAARDRLLQDGYARLSTRGVADLAGVPLSQVHYHFGGKQQLILSVLAREDERLLERQTRMYAEDRPLWQRYEQACDFLDEDLASGYVRVVQEMTAASWSDPEIAVQVRVLLQRWIDLLADVLVAAEQRGLALGPCTAREVATLVVLLFLGGESALLLGLESGASPVRRALRRIGDVIRIAETGGTS